MSSEQTNRELGQHSNAPGKTDPGNQHKLLSITLIINGTPEVVSINENAPLETLVRKGLIESGNVGRPLQDWQLKHGALLLELNKKVGDYDIQEGAELFLSLKAGHGG